MNLRCSECRKVIWAESGKLRGKHCPLCETGTLEPFGEITPAMVREMEMTS